MRRIDFADIIRLFSALLSTTEKVENRKRVLKVEFSRPRGKKLPAVNREKILYSILKKRSLTPRQACGNASLRMTPPYLPS